MLAMTKRRAARAASSIAVESRWRSDSGAEAAEFALVLPVLLTLLFGIISLGTVLYHYEMLVSATEAGCRYFAAARGTATPQASALAVVENYATGLSSSVLATRVTFSVNNVVCNDTTTTPTCYNALLNNPQTPATVTATYPCTIVVFGVNLTPGGCTLTQTLTEIVE